MRIATLLTDNGERGVIQEGNEFLLFTDGRTVQDVIEQGGAGPELKGDVVEGRLVAPFRPRTIIAIGLNYRDHIEEAGLDEPKSPLIFAKLPSSVIGPGDSIVLNSQVTTRVDWEVELAVVIGRTTRRVTVDNALDSVFGYTVANDVSARDLQFSDGQWTRSKSLDTFCPLGPAILTADELPDPQKSRLVSRVNDEVMQDSSTARMVNTVAELISFCSESFTLTPGDVLLTGTPHGVGEFMDPPRSLQAGDIVEVEVDGVGVLRNPVVDS